ncbi:2-dehydro-3-deoxygluconokinase [Halobacillus karajensis]|uniref:2-dehydro-3-deoxygluconokinase n=1 Tax=Halobacillus karajensis TaxID=195088 RepID=A0A059NXE6_9BACI|nr:sugar kinase [Halobacillus karajensis]CDQ18520.1 2-dehydro-3-deoxygluconokinase [Halobacillus karajensis]CDQ23408.1 2-dehydro-3-deoxygluconokinase [Halobacillus karajensis]CDQ26890.1 2-dehydro-3-deoxygluconokinase [Halobacillus karajensis]SEH50442.1 2-dehydro-3-deoxygluconokinase [Halobacillus karajensis]
MKDVLTIGDAMITFDPTRNGPLRNVHSFERKAGGAEFNFAIGCARLGLHTGWISRLGNDEFGKYIRNFARGEGIDVSAVKLVDGYPTSLNFKEIREDGSGSTFYYRADSPTKTLTEQTLDAEAIRQTKILHITGVFAAIDPDKNLRLLKRAVTIAKDNGALVSFDPNIRLKLWEREKAQQSLQQLLPYVDIILTGVEEAELLFGVSQADQIVAACERYGISTVAIKQGEKGAFGCMDGLSMTLPPRTPKKVVDTVGAGDGFDAGFIYGVLQGWSLERTLHFANTIGSMVVSVYGDNEGLPELEEVQIQLGEREYVER